MTDDPADGGGGSYGTPGDVEPAGEAPGEAAYRRLHARGYASSLARVAGAPEVMMAVVRMLTDDPAIDQPSREDIADALLLSGPVTEIVEASRAALIAAAKRDAGMTWPEVGRLLGMPDKRVIQRYYTRLVARVTARAATDVPAGGGEGS